MSDATYVVNEVFYSTQGEGVRSGTMNVFIRFTGCNLKCDLKEGPQSPGGFACDTEFMSGRKLTLPEIESWVRKEGGECKWLILTGGEPGLQVDTEFVNYFHSRGYKIAIETNGTQLLCEGIDWITVSPKVAEHAIKQRTANEVKYVRGYGQGIPRTVVEAEHYLISPAFDGGTVRPDVLQWCVNLCRENPEWRLSVQQHKIWHVR